LSLISPPYGNPRTVSSRGRGPCVTVEVAATQGNTRTFAVTV